MCAAVASTAQGCGPGDRCTSPLARVLRDTGQRLGDPDVGAGELRAAVGVDADQLAAEEIAGENRASIARRRDRGPAEAALERIAAPHLAVGGIERVDA